MIMYRNYNPIENIKFITAEKNAMETSKYIESQKAHRDLYFDDYNQPSQRFYAWWIENHAKNFREAWDLSLCKDCTNIYTCRDCLKDTCKNFILENKRRSDMTEEEREEKYEKELFDEENMDLFDDLEDEPDLDEIKELNFEN